MSSVNKVIIVGYLGQDPELKYTKADKAVCRLSVATSEKWKDRSDEWQERTEWHRIVVWGKQAESCNQYLEKGRLVYVEGKLQTNKWEDREGNTRYTTEIHASSVVFLGGGGNKRQSDEPPPAHPGSSGEDEIPF